MPDDQLPDAVAILNPKLEGETYPYKHLSGCGVGYKFMQGFAINNGIDITSDLEPLLDLVAVSIASDIVPITGENRILAYHGLKRLNSNPSMGLRGILKVCGLNNKNITISDIVFKIGPRINASGRMQSGKEAVDLLVAKDMAAGLWKKSNIRPSTMGIVKSSINNITERRAGNHWEGISTPSENRCHYHQRLFVKGIIGHQQPR